MRARAALLAVAAAVLCAPLAVAQVSGGVDIIKLKGDKEIKGKVLEVTCEKVSYAPPGGGQGQLSENYANVVEILYFDAPFGVTKGDALLKEGKADEAIPQYQKALDEVEKKRTRPLHKQYALFGIARAYQAQGDWDKALETYKRLIKECKDSCFKLEAYDGAIAAAQRKGNKGAIDELIGLMKGEKDSRIASKAELTIATSDLDQKKYKEAKDRFDKLVNDSDPSVQANARIGVIRCLAAENKLDDLKRACEQAIKSPTDSPALLAAAYTALGDAAFSQAAATKDPKLQKEALLHYLRTIVRYFPAVGEPSQDYEKALFQAGVCFLQLREALKKPESKAEYAARASALFEELIRDFKGSTWAGKAQEQIKSLKK